MERNDERLGSAPLGKLMVSMALPAVAAQVINVLYNIVDRIYIGHIAGYGELALTGVGVTAPILMVISAFSAFAGMGGAPQASIQLGKKNYEGAEKILGSSVAMLLLFSVVLTVFFRHSKLRCCMPLVPVIIPLFMQGSILRFTWWGPFLFNLLWD